MAVDEYYSSLRHYVRLLCEDQDSHSLVVNSEPGVGKSYQITEELKRSCEGVYKAVEGYLTPMNLVEALHQTKGEDDVLFLDDVSGIVGDEKGLNVLKSATWTVDEEKGRLITWGSTTAKLEVETPFRFRGSVVMCFNSVPENAHFEAVKSRSLYYELDLSRDQKLDIMREIAEKPKSGTTKGERLDVVGWLSSILTAAHKVNLRQYEHAIRLYRYAKGKDVDWRELFLDSLSADEDLKKARRCLDRSETVEEASSLFERKTGKSRSTFFRYKRQLEQ